MVWSTVRRYWQELTSLQSIFLNGAMLDIDLNWTADELQISKKWKNHAKHMAWSTRLDLPEKALKEE